MKFVALLFALIFSSLASLAHADPVKPGDIGIVDGDTITVRGNPHQVRLRGFDTPETGWGARCSAERALANKATQRLRDIVAAGGLDLAVIPCPCWRQKGYRACNDGRDCGVLKAKGRNVADIMISEGLARPLHCGKACPVEYSWCDRLNAAPAMR
jgi:endonuclease YncB( thermonuclease family)